MINISKIEYWVLLEIQNCLQFLFTIELCIVHSILILSILKVYIELIEYYSSILSSNKIIKLKWVEWVKIESCFINKNF